MKMKNGAVAALMSLGMLAAPVVAQAEGLTDKLNNLQISGFVDAAYFDDNTGQSAITLDQVEIDIEYSSGNVGLRFDINAFPSSQDALAADGLNGGPNGQITADALLEQGYVYYEIADVATFTFGKFNAPIGWELLDAPDMYQYSHALVFDNGLMTNLVGASLSTNFADGMVDVIGYVANGTDLNAANTASGVKTWGGRLGFTPTEGVNVGVSYAAGDNIGGTVRTPGFTIVDVDLTIELIDNLLIGAEYNATKNWTAANTKSSGWFVMGNYTFTDMFGATLRYGTFDFDKATGGSNTAITGALTAALGDGLGALIELRKHKNTSAALNAGLAANSTVTEFAFEMTYGF